MCVRVCHRLAFGGKSKLDANFVMSPLSLGGKQVEGSLGNYVYDGKVMSSWEGKDEIVAAAVQG